MNKPVVGITGANGFIGNAIRRTLQENDYPVIGLVRTPKAGERYFDLAKKPDQHLLNGIDILIHAAYDQSDRSLQGINFTGSKQLFAFAQQCGVQKIIFISSIAAHPAITSVYGKTKSEIEKCLPANRLIRVPLTDRFCSASFLFYLPEVTRIK